MRHGIWASARLPDVRRLQGASLQHSCVQTCSRKSLPCHSYEQPRNTFKTRGFKSIPCHSYKECPYKSFACHSYEKHRGWHPSLPKKKPVLARPGCSGPSKPSPPSFDFPISIFHQTLQAAFPRTMGHGPQATPRGPNFAFRISSLSQLWTIDCRLRSSFHFRFSDDSARIPYGSPHGRLPH